MTAKKNNRTKAQGAETKLQLYRCAEELLLQRDYQEISIESITKMAGVSKGTFYVHFESKDALYVSIFSQYVETLDAQYEQFLAALSPEMPAYDKLLALVAGIIDRMTAQIGYETMKNLYRLQISKTVNTEVVNGRNRRLYGLFEQVLESGIRQGDFVSTLSVEALTRHFVMAIRGLTYEWCIRDVDFDLKQKADTHFRLLLNGIRAHR